jgi:3-oxoacyl-[acyl-carrier-protein] synthase III
MILGDVYIAGCAVSLPERVSVEDAIAAGRYDDDERAASGQIAATVAAPHERACDLAARAGTVALQEAGVEPGAVALLVHAVVFSSGVGGGWQAASYVQSKVCPQQIGCLTYEVRAGCAGSLVGVLNAAMFLRCFGNEAALVTAADKWPDPDIDRWRGHVDVLGDAGGAVVLHRDRGWARVVSAGVATEPELEGQFRGNSLFVGQAGAGVRGEGTTRVDLTERTREFERSTMPHREVMRRMRRGVLAAVTDALDGAGLKMADVGHAALSFGGRRSVERLYLEPLSLDWTRTAADWGLTIGHTGASDPMAGLAYLRSAGRLEAGEKVMLLGVGGGHVFAATIVEIQEPAASTGARIDAWSAWQ